MGLRFPYRLLKTKLPVLPLGGRPERPRPVATVSVIGPGGTFVETCWVDTASDDTVFPEEVADKIGIDLTSAPCGGAAGVGQLPLTLRYAEVTLRMASDGERREWRAWVGFTSAPMNRPLLGFAGFLQFFTATFRGDREEVELEVNSLYPGT